MVFVCEKARTKSLHANIDAATVRAGGVTSTIGFFGFLSDQVELFIELSVRFTNIE